MIGHPFRKQQLPLEAENWDILKSPRPLPPPYPLTSSATVARAPSRGLGHGSKFGGQVEKINCAFHAAKLGVIINNCAGQWQEGLIKWRTGQCRM